MVKKLLKFLSYSLFFIFALILFVPKNSIYYFAEENLKQFDLVISNESLEDNFTTLKVKNLEISAKSIDAGVVEELDLTLLLVYNKLLFTNIELSSLVESYLPSKIENLEISYTLLNPLFVEGKSKGVFGDAHMFFNLQTRELSVSLHPSKKMFSSYRNSLKYFKKSATGEYVYAKTF